ncbi:MAG: MATE family efflux transporter [Sedimentisphaerales bacterium]
MKNNSEKITVNEGGPREVLKIAFPLILSTSAYTLQLFVDRVFLMWYDRDAMSAAFQGGMLNFVFFSFFLGTATYANTFVSQYDGANMKKRIGPAVWQSVYFSIFAGLIMASIAFFSRQIIALVGHPPKIAGFELIYFKILLIGSMSGLVNASLSCFLTGRGKTWTVFWVDISGTIVNIVLDYVMIFGKFGFPEWGVGGAAIATVISNTTGCVIYFIIFLLSENRKNFGTAIFKPDTKLFGGLMKFGLPSGMQFMLDILGFTIFVIFIGRIDPVSFAASSMALNINTLAFMPMIGFGMATTVLVGRALGADKPQIAQKATISAAYITFAYMTVVAVGYWFLPQVFMIPYKLQASAEQFEALKPIVARLLCFVAFYSLFDTGNIIFAGALKGAGDTRFVMWISIFCNWLLMVVPSWASVTFLQGRARLYGAWLGLTSYVCVLAILFFLRFLAGKWKTMRVIEKAPVLPGKVQTLPTAGIESV